MNRLDAEVRRLFLSADAGGVRALVLGLARPAQWAELAPAWQGVQADLDLPAPAIAVDGHEAFQLWFSLAEPVPREHDTTFLQGLARRYLAAVLPQRLQLLTAPDAVPPAQRGPERWSAFVAPDLAPLFSGEPWLDHPPGADAQADLLSRLQCTPADAFRRAAGELQPAAAPPGAPARPAAPAGPADGGQPLGAREFLLAVMRDPAVDLALRIEAAKALLADDRR